MTHVSPTTPPPPYTSQFTFPKKHIITNTLVSFTESLCVSLPSQKSLFPNKQITKILESTDMALGLPSSCPTRLHACPSSFFFFSWKKWGTWLDATWSQPKKQMKTWNTPLTLIDLLPPPSLMISSLVFFFFLSGDLLPLLPPLIRSLLLLLLLLLLAQFRSVFLKDFPFCPFHLVCPCVCVYLYFAFIFSTNPHVNSFFLNLSLYIYIYIYIYTYN